MDKTAYFNNAATTFPKPEEVYSFVDEFYRKSGLNSGRGQNDSTSKSFKIQKSIVGDVSLPCQKVVFTPSATEAINVVLQGLP